MTSPFLETACTLAVVLGLYGFLCYWEAARADLAAKAWRGDIGREPGAAGYRTRGRLALAGSGAIALGLLVSAWR